MNGRTLVTALTLALSACSSLPENSASDLADQIFGPNASVPATDARASFRQVYCSINEDHGESLPDYRPCDEALRRVPPEEQMAGPATLPETPAALFDVLIVPGLGFDCFAKLIGDEASLHLAVEPQGHEVYFAPIKGLGTSAENAAIIRDAVMDATEQADSKRLLLLGYSKGTNDILMALTTFPELARRVSAVVGVSSAVGGSELSQDVSLRTLNLLTHIPGAECEDSTEQTLLDLDPDVRKEWLEKNELPRAVRYYSVVTFPDADHVSAALKPGYRELAEIDPRNDGQVIAANQVIPGSQVLAFANADHWAIALPISRTRPLAGSTAINHNDFPREVLLQAILEYVGMELTRE